MSLEFRTSRDGEITFSKDGQPIRGQARKSGDEIILQACPKCGHKNQINIPPGKCNNCGFTVNSCFEVRKEGIDKFPENKALIKFGKKKKDFAEFELSKFNHPKYHGPKRPGCVLVKKRKERTYKDKHYIDIYTCLTHGEHIECLRSGWEVGWWMGEDNRNLK